MNSSYRPWICAHVAWSNFHFNPGDISRVPFRDVDARLVEFYGNMKWILGIPTPSEQPSWTNDLINFQLLYLYAG